MRYKFLIVNEINIRKHFTWWSDSKGTSVPDGEAEFAKRKPIIEALASETDISKLAVDATFRKMIVDCLFNPNFIELLGGYESLLTLESVSFRYMCRITDPLRLYKRDQYGKVIGINEKNPLLLDIPANKPDIIIGMGDPFVDTGGPIIGIKIMAKQTEEYMFFNPSYVCIANRPWRCHSDPDNYAREFKWNYHQTECFDMLEDRDYSYIKRILAGEVVNECYNIQARTRVIERDRVIAGENKRANIVAAEFQRAQENATTSIQAAFRGYQAREQEKARATKVAAEVKKTAQQQAELKSEVEVPITSSVLCSTSPKESPKEIPQTTKLSVKKGFCGFL